MISDLASRYHYDDFTRDEYRRMLRLAKERYSFRSYTDFKRDESFILWRHDLDMSVHDAVAFAQIEAEEGLRTTYFLLPNSPFYNLLEPSIMNCVKQIAALGHRFGLHFDMTAANIESESALEAALTEQRRWLEVYCGHPIEVFSYHNPTTSSALSLDALIYAGMVNCYASYFRNEVPYCSDSNGIWRHASLEDSLNSGHARLHVLTHPEWWTHTPMSPRERVLRCIDGRARHTLEEYNHILYVNHRENVCDLDAEFHRLSQYQGQNMLPIQMQWLRGDYAGAFLALWTRAAPLKTTAASTTKTKAIAQALIDGKSVTYTDLLSAMRALIPFIVDAV